MGGSLDARGDVVKDHLERMAATIALRLGYYERAKAEAEREHAEIGRSLDDLDSQAMRKPRSLDEVLCRQEQYCRLEDRRAVLTAKIDVHTLTIRALTAEHASIRARIALLEHDVEAWLDWAAKTPMGEAYAYAVA